MIQFGEAGAGTFSDGKLTSRVRDLRGRKVLEEFVQAGAPEDILYKAHPHGAELIYFVTLLKTSESKLLSWAEKFILMLKLKSF